MEETYTSKLQCGMKNDKTDLCRWSVEEVPKYSSDFLIKVGKSTS